MNDINAGSTPLTLIALTIIFFALMAIKMVNQGYTYAAEHLGRYHKIPTPGLYFLSPSVNSIRERIDMREQVVPFPPQPAITSDNTNISIDTVIYYQVTNPITATYEITDPMAAIEWPAVITLWNIIGATGMEQALTGRDQISDQLRGQLNGATGYWGIRVSRVELKIIDPPRSVQDTMKQQMKTEHDRRAAVPTVESIKQSAVLMTEDKKQSAIPGAEGQAQLAIPRTQSEARAILQVSDVTHHGNTDPEPLPYEYIKALPQVANSSSSKLWVVLTEMTAAPSTVARGPGGHNGDGESGVDFGGIGKITGTLATMALPDIDNALTNAKGAIDVTISETETSGHQSGYHFDPDMEAGQRPATPAPPGFRGFNREDPNGNRAPPVDQ